MVIQVNGKKSELPADVKTVSDLLNYYELDKKVVIVELNESIMNKDDHDGTEIKEGDQIELVQFVGGG
ncbi:sulfur carrier protein ThiS [Bacillus shivajii]|uniref:sulfur carrier protein ThiS n=1 Tax=Bacillus shivajii TaxID=1983719 RepID=UPI001CFA0587|nr:sulfur carrier protein ThiS [Bacillus shivajii]UCZ52345.1 sulfur carrier protein ThiS [Bacillus shivajii]